MGLVGIVGHCLVVSGDFMNESSNTERYKPTRIWSEVVLHSVIAPLAGTVNLREMLSWCQALRS